MTAAGSVTAPTADNSPPRPVAQPGTPWLWLVSLFLTGWGAKIWLINRFGTPLPFWDQWMEATSCYIPYFQGHLSWSDLFSGHNETRPFFSRIYGLALLLINGQWDAEMQMVLNAAVHALTLAGFGWLVARLVGPRCWPLLWLPLAAVMVAPFAWESTLAGLHSQYYFTLLFSLPTLWFLGQYRAWSGRWWLGVLTGFCALFNLASGFIAGSAVFALMVLKVFKNRNTLKQHLPTLVAGAAISLAGVLVKADAPYHQPLMAHSVFDFVFALGNNLAWPWIVIAPYALINFLPFLVLAWFYLRSREDALRAEELTLATGFWVIISAMATAYARGTGGALPQWRYMDITSFALTTNVVAMLILLGRYRERLWLARYAGLACVVWALVNAAGLWLLTARAWKLDIPERAFYHHSQLRGERAFIATDDNRYLRTPPQKEQRALFNPDLFERVLREPDIRARLPACARDPLKVAPATSDNAAFVPRGWKLEKPDPPTEMSWGSYNTQGAAATGVFESQPVKAGRLPYLEIEVAGDLGQPGLSLELVDLKSQKRTVVRPRRIPGGRWERCQVKAPAGDFKIVARDDSATAWFAFRPPAEMGWMSWLTAKILPWGSCLSAGGVGLYGLALLLDARARRRIAGAPARPPTGTAGK